MKLLADSCKPDVAFAASQIATRDNKPMTQHMILMRDLLQYLRGTTYHCITFRASCNDIKIMSFPDADFAENKDRKSITAAVHIINLAPVTWSLKMQSIAVLRTRNA